MKLKVKGQSLPGTCPRLKGKRYFVMWIRVKFMSYNSVKSEHAYMQRYFYIKCGLNFQRISLSLLSITNKLPQIWLKIIEKKTFQKLAEIHHNFSNSADSACTVQCKQKLQIDNSAHFWCQNVKKYKLKMAEIDFLYFNIQVSFHTGIITYKNKQLFLWKTLYDTKMSLPAHFTSHTTVKDN